MHKRGSQREYLFYAKWAKVSVPKVVKLKVNSKKGRKLIVKYAKKSGIKGYKIMYATNSKFTKNRKVKYTKKITLSVKCAMKTTYYVKVRAYKLDSTGKNVYGKYSKVRKIKIKR